MQQGDEQAQSARSLLASAFHGVLSTHSLEHEGYPFGSVVPYVLDQAGAPVMLLSHLSQHTKNLDADPRCGLTVMEAGSGDVQQRSRLSAVGDVTQPPATADVERYFDYFPQTRPYHDELGFRFYRFQPTRFHWNGGFATARWFAAGRILRASPFSRQEERQMLGHMNQDHTDALQFYLRKAAERDIDAAVVMVGIDGEGMNLRVGDQILRVPFAHEVTTVEEARQILVEMATRAS